MTVKLALLRSGEDIITHVEEMVVKSEDGRGNVIGYRFHKPCAVKLVNENDMVDKKGNKAYEINMGPWIPLSKAEIVPVCVDWVITLVDPIDKLLDLYELNVIGNGKRKGKIVDSNGNVEFTDGETCVGSFEPVSQMLIDDLNENHPGLLEDNDGDQSTDTDEQADSDKPS